MVIGYDRRLVIYLKRDRARCYELQWACFNQPLEVIRFLW